MQADTLLRAAKGKAVGFNAGDFSGTDVCHSRLHFKQPSDNKCLGEHSSHDFLPGQIVVNLFKTRSSCSLFILKT